MWPLEVSNLTSDLVARVCSDLMKRMRMKKARVSCYEDDAKVVAIGIGGGGG
ncbi:hypothetical protein HanRHA438_Chr03g0106921 [Helianthus annuus]|nr:hypothetical protein HanRHA438_Chr03g0106921 [Helianthus annuus]